MLGIADPGTFLECKIRASAYVCKIRASAYVSRAAPLMHPHISAMVQFPSRYLEGGAMADRISKTSPQSKRPVLLDSHTRVRRDQNESFTDSSTWRSASE